MTEETKKHEDEPEKEPQQLIDLNQPGLIKDCGSVTDPVCDIVDLGSIH